MSGFCFVRNEETQIQSKLKQTNILNVGNKKPELQWCTCWNEAVNQMALDELIPYFVYLFGNTLFGINKLLTDYQ